MADKNVRYCEWIRIGKDSGNYEEINYITGYADRQMSPDSEEQMEVIPTINNNQIQAVKDKHKFWEIMFTLNTDNIEGMWAEDVTVGGGASDYAIEQTEDNFPIGYLVVYLEMIDGSHVTRTFQTTKSWVSRANGSFTNRPQTVIKGSTTYKLVCIGTRTDS